MRGIRGNKAHLAAVSRRTTSSDGEGNPETVSTVTWQGRGTAFDFESEEVLDSAGRPAQRASCTFRVRINADVNAGDFCDLMGETWYVNSIERTPQCIRLKLITPAPQPFR